MTGTGQKKCVPPKRARFFSGRPISLSNSDDVFVEKIVSLCIANENEENTVQVHMHSKTKQKKTQIKQKWRDTIDTVLSTLHAREYCKTRDLKICTVLSRDSLELGEQRLLRLEVLDDRLDHEVGLGAARGGDCGAEVCGGRDARARLLHELLLLLNAYT